MKLRRLSNCWWSELWRRLRDVWGNVTDGHFIIPRLILEFHTKYKERSLKYFQHGRGVFWSPKWQDSSCCYVESGLDWIGGKAETRVMLLKQLPWEVRAFSANAVAVNVMSVACTEGGRMLERSSWHRCFLGVASVQETLMDVLGGRYQTSLWFQIIWVLCHTEESNSQVLRWDLFFQIMIMLGKKYTVIVGYNRGFFDISLFFSCLKHPKH